MVVYLHCDRTLVIYKCVYIYIIHNLYFISFNRIHRLPNGTAAEPNCIRDRARGSDDIILWREDVRIGEAWTTLTQFSGVKRIFSGFSRCVILSLDACCTGAMMTTTVVNNRHYDVIDMHLRVHAIYLRNRVFAHAFRTYQSST